MAARPSPVKYLPVGYLYGIPSERQTARRIQTDMALGGIWGWIYSMRSRITAPFPSSGGGSRRFGRHSRSCCSKVVRQCVAAGLAGGRLVGTDSTHVRANASRAPEAPVELPVEPRAYWRRLDACEEDVLKRLAEKLGRRRKKRTKQAKKDSRRSHRRVSRTIWRIRPWTPTPASFWTWP